MVRQVLDLSSCGEGKVNKVQCEPKRTGGGDEVKPEEYSKLDGCHKVKMVLDKDVEDFQYDQSIREVCAKGRGLALNRVRRVDDGNR